MTTIEVRQSTRGYKLPCFFQSSFIKGNKIDIGISQFNDNKIVVHQFTDNGLQSHFFQVDENFKVEIIGY
jgi:hypothetical protein